MVSATATLTPYYRQRASPRRRGTEVQRKSRGVHLVRIATSDAPDWSEPDQSVSILPSCLRIGPMTRTARPCMEDYLKVLILIAAAASYAIIIK
jgi:hypothetical protein